jgi:hypothetical protein
MSMTRFVGTMLAVTMVAATGLEVRATNSSAKVVIEWNQLLQSTLAAPGNPLTPRYFAMMHIAMFDAVNAIEREFEPYRVRLRSRAGGSPDAAAAQAAHDVLVAINPSAAATYDSALAANLGQRPSGFVRRGAETGALVAAEVLEWRQNEPLLAGRWQPTLPASATAVFTHVLSAAPMAAASSTHFLPPPPPPLTSARYAADVNEVKRLGRNDSSDRTEEQTTIARLWSAVGTTTGFFSVWNDVTADVANARHLSLVEAARLFVLVNVSIHDALQTTQASKFVYGVWRPITAIRGADTDLNPATDADPTWLSLITTPAYPSYAGNLMAIAASAARMLELFSGNNAEPVAITWKQTGGLPDVTRHFASFAAVADEEFMARIYGGVHYRFDQEAGQQVGRSVADYVFANFMAPRSRWHD